MDKFFQVFPEQSFLVGMGGYSYQWLQITSDAQWFVHRIRKASFNRFLFYPSYRPHRRHEGRGCVTGSCVHLLLVFGGYTNDWIISHTIVSFRISPMLLNSRLMMLPERKSSVIIPIGRIPFCDKRRMPISNTTATVRLQMLSMILALIILIFSMNNPFGDVPAPIL